MLNLGLNDILHGDEHLDWCFCNTCTDEVVCHALAEAEQELLQELEYDNRKNDE